MESANTPEIDEAVNTTVAFLTTVFAADDIVLFRPIETWTENGRKQSKVDYSNTGYCRADPAILRASVRELLRSSEKSLTNLFFGVCPRFGRQGEYDLAWQIRTVRCLWADIDHVSVDEALERVEKACLPTPSISVNSGNGVHMYWLLDEPYLIDDVADPLPVKSDWIEIQGKKKRISYFVDPNGDRVNLHDPVTAKPSKANEPDLSPKAVQIQDVIHGLATAIGADHTFDLSRIMRLPGTSNRKDQRNGGVPRPCLMVHNNGCRYPFDRFVKLADSSPSRQRREKIATALLPARKRMTVKRKSRLADLIQACDTAAPGERSECDYRLCCWSIESGLTSAEVWPRVSNVGKFAERGEDYFLRTWTKAEAQTKCKIIDRDERRSAVTSSQEIDSEQSNDDRVEIEITTREHDINNSVIAALGTDGSLYQRAGQLVSVVYGPESADGMERPSDAPRIVPMPLASIRELISKHVEFYVETESEEGSKRTPRHVPDWCSRAVHARGEWSGIRVLRGIVNHPVIRPDGTVLTEAGYDAQTGLILYWPGEPLEIPLSPTRDEVVAAIARLKQVIVDFPFESDAHRAGWLAFLLTALVRHAFRHAITAPLFLIDASIRGSGKTLLADIVGMIICGFALPRMILPKDDEEMRKHMLCLALASDEFALFDNVVGDLGGQTLDAVLTGTHFKGRVLGESRDVSVAISTTFAATANNASIAGDMCRRTIPLRLSSPLENPEERDNFQIPNVLNYVRDHRRELLTDAITLLRAYLVAGRPDMNLTAMGSFEDWSSLVRGTLVWCGEPDPWETRVEFAQRADSGTQTLGELLGKWRSIDPDDRGVTVTELLHRLETNPQYHGDLKSAISDLCNCKPGGVPNSKVLGRRLSGVRDRVYRGQRLVSKPNRQGVMVWRVESVDPQVLGLQGVAGFISGTSREEKISNPLLEPPTAVPYSTATQHGSPETLQNPANPADRSIGYWEQPETLRGWEGLTL